VGGAAWKHPNLIKVLIFRAKTSKYFFFEEKNRVFLAVDDRKELKTLSKKGCSIKKNHSVSERVELELSSHAFISISIFLTKTDFFEGGGLIY
jgi:hypothetical protein